MTAPRPAAGPPSRSGVRRAGDQFQDLIVWGAAMRVIGPERKFSQVEVEINAAGNVDDVVLRGRTADGDRHGQVKWATRPADLVDEDLLTALPRGGAGRSLLQKLYDSYIKLRANGAKPTLQLITNRALDGAHPLLGQVDGRTDMLMPHAAQAAPQTTAGQAVDRWAEHVNAARHELLEMLEHLQFLTGRTIGAERDHVRTLMLAAGLDGSDDALQHGLNTVASWVVGGKRVVTEHDIHQAVDRLRRGDPSALLIVQAIDIDPHADEATLALNWVDLFDGDRPGERVQPRDKDYWEQMDCELTAAAATIEDQGWTSTVIRGAMRQATFFRIGTTLPRVRNHTLHYLQGEQIWSTETAKTPIPQPNERRIHLPLGHNLAVAVGMTLDPTDEVLAYLRAANIPVGHLLTIAPAAGAHDQAVAGPGQAVAYAEQIRNLVRADLVRKPHADVIHLFLAGPGGLALLLGNRWNRTRPTVVYEHLGIGRGYTPAYNITA